MELPISRFILLSFLFMMKSCFAAPPSSVHLIFLCTQGSCSKGVLYTPNYSLTLIIIFFQGELLCFSENKNPAQNCRREENYIRFPCVQIFFKYTSSCVTVTFRKYSIIEQIFFFMLSVGIIYWCSIWFFTLKIRYNHWFASHYVKMNE